MTILFFFPFFISFVCVMVILASNEFHERFTHDTDLSSTQKFHATPVPRIGGAAFFIGLSSLLFTDFFPEKMVLAKLLIAGAPIFFMGLFEDLTKKIGASTRFWVSLFSGTLLYVVANVHFERMDAVWVDPLFALVPFTACLMTVWISAGVSHAMNIIDGFNGLLLGVSFLMCVVIGCTANQVNDAQVLSLSLLCAGSILGLFVFNYPFGKIFTGDGGAYLIGFLVSALSLMLVERNKEVSAWFPCLLLAYPVFETLFSIYRKSILRKQSPLQPDGVHLHMLIFKRTAGRKNAKTSLYLWGLTLVSVIPAGLFWNNTAASILFCIIFALAYLQLYWSLVRFRNLFLPFQVVKWLKCKMQPE